MSKLRSFVLLLLSIWVAPALAVDGVIELNQASILANGGYPYALDRGNYRLTSDLVPGSVGGLSLEGDEIVIDFNGFALIGDGSVVHGIDGGSAPDGHVMKNGTIRGFGGKAVTLVERCRIEDMQILGNGQGGLEVGPHCLVRGTVFRGNGGFGGLAGQGAGVVYANSLFYDNQGGNVSGARSMGTSFCDGETCASPPMRRFYLTTTSHDGNAVDEPGVCAQGFHFASLWEILDPSHLRYDETLGLPHANGGGGPPSASGWVRTVDSPAGSTSTVGWANCFDWTSAGSSDAGIGMRLTDDFGRSSIDSPIGHWKSTDFSCDTNVRAWCVQD